MLRLRLVTSALLAGVLLAPLTLPAQSPTGQLYRDPGGRFSITVPNGWQLTSQNGGAILAHGNASAVVTPFKGASSGRELVNQLASQYASQWRNFSPVNNGDFQLAGQPGSYATYSGVSPKGVNSVLRLSGIASRGEGFAFIISAPSNEFNQASPDFQAIEGSFTLGTGGNGGGNGGNAGGFDPSNGGNAPAIRPGQAVLGVQSRDVEQADLQQLGLRDTQGALIATVQPGSAADQAGVQPGDVVTSVDRAPIAGSQDLRQQVANHRAGDRMTLGVIRRGQAGTIQVQLAAAGGSNGGGVDPNSPNTPNPGAPGGYTGGQGGNDPNTPQVADSNAADQQQPLTTSDKIQEFVRSPAALLIALTLVALVVWRSFKKP